MPVSSEINGVFTSESIRRAIAQKIGKEKKVFQQYCFGNKRLHKNTIINNL
jgi:hypothetical protein